MQHRVPGEAHKAVEPAEPQRRDEHQKDDILVSLEAERHENGRKASTTREPSSGWTGMRLNTPRPTDIEPTMDRNIPSVCIKTVSYTHLTLPTKRIE